MTRIKIFHLIFCLAALIFIAKPFIGFGVAGHLKSSVKTNILAKIFSKRNDEKLGFDIKAIHKQLSQPATNLFLRFAFLLAILFSLAFKASEAFVEYSSRRLQLRLLPQQLNLFTGKLLI